MFGDRTENETADTAKAVDGEGGLRDVTPTAFLLPLAGRRDLMI
jgi:hypothetical protein